jgi:acetoin utilization protein AcuC
MAIAILYREELMEYDFGIGHPLTKDRHKTFLKFLKENLPEDENYKILQAEPATDKDLSLICQKDYVDFTKNYFRARNLGEDYNGKFFQYHSRDNFPLEKPGKLEEAARIIIGQAKLACDLIQKGNFKKVISLGGGAHHAKKNYGEGFCLYNDVAFAGKYLIKRYKLKNILILDTDAHCGNGTMEYFYSDSRVLFIDLHQYPKTLYPGTGFVEQIGKGEGRGFTINIPLPMFAGDDSYKLVFEEIIEPVTKEFKPQIIIRNGGSDPHFADELTQLGLTIEGFKIIGEKVKKMAEICDGKVIDLIGSGYNKTVLPYGWLSLISALADFKIEIKEPVIIPKQFQKDYSLEKTKSVIKQVKKNLKDYWKCFK